jgi:subtilase family serine protease
LNLNSSTGVISGTPTTPGVFNFTAQVTDVQPTTDTQPLSITIIENKPALPDLVVSSLSAQGSVKAGSTINISDTTANNGTGTAASSTTRFYLSTDITIGGDTKLGERTVPSLSATSSSSGRTSVIIPAGTAKGNYYIIAVADADNGINELNDNNNAKAVSIRVR